MTEVGAATVLDSLEAAGFRRLPKPLLVAGTTFDFDAAVTGTGVSHDLVVVGSVDTEPRRLAQLMSGLGRSLDWMESRRPVSLVLLGTRPEQDLLTELESNARVLLIEVDEPTKEAVTEAIAVLLPLRLPTATQRSIDPLEELSTELGSAITDEHRTLIDAARIGPEAVRDAFQGFVEGAFLDEREHQAES